MDVAERITLEPAAEEDAEQLAEICKRAFDTDVDVGAPEGGEGPPGYDSLDFQIWAMGAMDFHKVLLDASIVGGVIVGSKMAEHKVLERIFVEPDHFNRGIGTRAMELAFDMYPDAKLWTLGTPEWNVRTKNFYEKLGFVQVGWDLADPNWRGIWYEKVMDPSDPYRMTGTGDLMEGMGNVDVEGEIVEKAAARTVRSRRRWQTLSVANSTLQDDTGSVVLVLWNEQIKLAKLGDRVRIENGYVNSFRGVTQLNVGRAGRLIHLI